MRLWGLSWRPEDPSRAGAPSEVLEFPRLGRAGLGKLRYGEDRCFSFRCSACHKLFPNKPCFLLSGLQEMEKLPLVCVGTLGGAGGTLRSGYRCCGCNPSPRLLFLQANLGLGRGTVPGLWSSLIQL